MGLLLCNEVQALSLFFRAVDAFQSARQKYDLVAFTKSKEAVQMHVMLLESIRGGGPVLREVFTLLSESDVLILNLSFDGLFGNEPFRMRA